MTNTVAILLCSKGLRDNRFAGIIDVTGGSMDDLQRTVEAILGGPKPVPEGLAQIVPDTIVEKHDPFLPKEMRDLGYGSRSFDVEGAWKWLSEHSQFES